MLFCMRTSSSQSLEKENFSGIWAPRQLLNIALTTPHSCSFPLPGCCPSTWSHLCPATCSGEGQNSTFVLFWLVWDINCQELGKLCLQAELLCTTSLLHIPSLPNLPAVLGDANLGSDPRRWERGENPLLSWGFGAGFGICWIMWLSRAFPSIPQRVFVCSSLVFNVSTNRVGYSRGRAGD